MVQNTSRVRYNDLKADQGKLRYDLIPITSLEGMAQIFTYGANKYNDFNWYQSIRPMRYYAAAMRHIMSLQQGQKLDPESGLKHIDHAIVSLIMYREIVEKLEALNKAGVDTNTPLTYKDFIKNIKNEE